MFDPTLSEEYAMKVISLVTEEVHIRLDRILLENLRMKIGLASLLADGMLRCQSFAELSKGTPSMPS